jgi:N6-adenosine-specific RNA methylase IME4
LSGSEYAPPPCWPSGSFSVVYADPPWRFDLYNNETGNNWVGDHYPLMDEAAIHALPVGGLCAKDCVLFLWGTWPTLPRAVRTVEAWGFTFKTVAFVWVKTNKDVSPFLGMGYWTRSNTEFCLLATRGSPRRVSCAVPQLVFSTRGRHSAKPPEVRDRIVRLMGDVPRVELFARERVQGWEAWGNEVEANAAPHTGAERA